MVSRNPDGRFYVKVLFVDDDRQRLSGVRALVQQAHIPVAASFVENQHAASEELARNSFDIVVGGFEQPDDQGARAIRMVEAANPTMARLAVSADGWVRDKVAAHMFLAPPFGAYELKRALYGTVLWRDRMSNTNLSELVAGARELPSLPEVYMNVRQEMASEDPSMQRIGEIVQGDPATSVRILRVVNSSLFGLRSEVGDVVQAAALLGMQTISSLALAAGLFAASDLDRRFLERLWHESLQAGALARLIAKDVGMGRSDVEEAQLAGLLHDIGEFVLFKNWPKQFLGVDPANRDHEELVAFGATHADIGGYLATLWELPIGVVDAITNHHTPTNGRFPENISPVLGVHVARALIDAKLDPIRARVDLDYLDRFGGFKALQRWAEIGAELD
jgi:HD-like signal output (HDOD) protein